MAATSWLTELQVMNAQAEKMSKRLSTLPVYDAPEPIETRVPLPKEKAKEIFIDDADIDENADLEENTEGGIGPDMGDGGGDDDFETDAPERQTDRSEIPSPTTEQVQKLNEISAREVVKNYSLFVNALSVEGFEWKNGDTEAELIKQRDILRLHIKNERSSLTPEEQNAIHIRIDDITQMLEKHKERRSYLDESTKLTPEKQEEAARLLADIWRVKNIEVSPWWGLVIIACAPIVNALIIIFMDGKRLKLGGL